MKPVFSGNWFSMGFTAHGPLRWTHLALEIFMKSAGHGIPLTINGEPMAGVTGTVTIAGTIAVGNAEILAGIIVSQVLEPGWSSALSSPESRNTKRTGPRVQAKY